MSEEGIDKMDRFGHGLLPYMYGTMGAGIGALAIDVPPYVSKGHKPTSALGYAVGGAAGYGLGKMLQDPSGLKKISG